MWSPTSVTFGFSSFVPNKDYTDANANAIKLILTYSNNNTYIMWVLYAVVGHAMGSG